MREPSQAPTSPQPRTAGILPAPARSAGRGAGWKPAVRATVAICLLQIAHAFGAEDFAQNPDYAALTQSNGEKAVGLFQLTPGKKLEIFDVNKNKRFSVDASEVARVTVSIEEEKLESGWMFKEEGFNDKIKLPYKYPLRKLFTDVTLTNGATLHGHTTTIFYLENEKEETQRFFLVSNQKGEKNQQLTDVVYVKDIVMPNRKIASGKLGTVQAPPNTTLLFAARDMTLEQPLTGLLPGKYDAFIFNKAEIRYGLSGTPATPEQIKAIDAKLQPIEEFFTKKKIIAAVFDGKTAHVFMELTRPEASYEPEWRHARWEVWRMEPTQESWEIRKRLYLFRKRIPVKDGIPAYQYKAEEGLKGLSENAVVK